MITGDVRGKGLDAILLARQVLSAFRRSAVAMPALEHVAGAVGRAIGPHLGEEDFVTAALVQMTPSGELTIANCGHHPPLLRHGDGDRDGLPSATQPQADDTHLTDTRPAHALDANRATAPPRHLRRLRADLAKVRLGQGQPWPVDLPSER